MPYPLQNLLELRERAEQAAETRLGEATAALQAAHAEQQTLRTVAQKAAQHADAERARRSASQTTDVLEAQRLQSYLDGLRADARTAEQRADTHQREIVAPATQAETEARTAHLEARREREVLTRHRDNLAEETRLTQARREEDNASDLATAAHARRGREP